MSRTPPPAMDITSFEALQRATIAHAQAAGVNRPALATFERAPANVMKLQRDYCRAVFARGTDMATFTPPKTFSADYAAEMHGAQKSILRSYFDFLKQKR